ADGGTGIEANAADHAISEITVGAALFAPAVSRSSAARPPAAGFVAAVMRRPAHDLYVCLGGGYNTAATFAKAGLPQPFLPHGATLDYPYAGGEGHLPVCYPGELRLGDPLFLRPPNAGELCERFRELLLVQGGAIVGVA